MKTTLPLGWLMAVLGGLTATGCIASSEDPNNAADAPPPAQSQAVITNAVVTNAVVTNAVVTNAVVTNALLSSPLTQASLVLQSQPGGPLEDPSAREVFSYIVSCALPKGQELTYTDTQNNVYTFDGELGIAAEWGKPHGQCDEFCQQWVSGCVISRVDYLGEHVLISIRGQNPVLRPSAQEKHDYSHREATYFGNIFSKPQRLLACLPPGQTTDPRVCGPSIDGCGIQFVGSCADVCGPVRPDGSYPHCRGPSDQVDGDDDADDADKAYFGSVTVFTH